MPVPHVYPPQALWVATGGGRGGRQCVSEQQTYSESLWGTGIPHPTSLKKALSGETNKKHSMLFKDVGLSENGEESTHGYNEGEITSERSNFFYCRM